MCTVSYVPKNKADYILTSSRDESIDRPTALLPKLYYYNETHVLQPADPLKGGTWIGVSKNNQTSHKRTLCLLNGAFEKHEPNPKYDISRGKIVHHFFLVEDIVNEIELIDLDRVEPFTLIIIERASKNMLMEFKWDGHKKHLLMLDQASPHIWSSSTLYEEHIRETKATLFSSFINAPKDATALFALHENGVKENPNIMKYINSSSRIKTLSITQIEFNNDNATMLYKNLLDSNIYKSTIDLVK